jgi:hypothetical protein
VWRGTASQFYQEFHLRKMDAEELLQVLEISLPPSVKAGARTLEEKLLLTLRYYTHDQSYQGLSQGAGKHCP